jgi:hypothetical protein
MLEDLEGSLHEFITSKAASPQAPGAQDALPAPLNLSYRTAQQQQRRQPAPPAPAPPAIRVDTAPEIRVDTAPPVVEVVEEVKEMPPAGAEDGGGGGFGGLSPEFLKDVQDGLEALGYDLTSSDVVQVCGGAVTPHW